VAQAQERVVEDRLRIEDGEHGLETRMRGAPRQLGHDAYGTARPEGNENPDTGADRAVQRRIDDVVERSGVSGRGNEHDASDHRGA
jgi:hypothetical protein